MEALNFSCQGESHIKSGKVCQDYSYSQVYENGYSIAIVCDGHGGQRYFRSNIGAKIAAQVAKEKVSIFISGVGESLLKRQPFTQKASVSTQTENQDFNKQSSIDKAFRQLFASIIFEWNQSVLAHAKDNPILDEEKTGLEKKWISEFEAGEKLEKVYGCTLILYASTADFWFAFQIGDGKCFSMDKQAQWSEPIPWDDKCFLNKTTSICDSSAIDEFRFCYDGDGNFPVAIFLGSDGIDDSFGAEENQENFYVQILKTIVKEGRDATFKEIETTLPQLSKIGSKDDMSIAMIYNNEILPEIYPKLIDWQIQNVKSHISEEEEKIRKAASIQESLESIKDPTKQNIIDLQYAKADEKSAIETRTNYLSQLDNLLKEMDTPL